MAPKKEDFNSEICEFKHSSIDKDIDNIQEDIGEIRKEENSQHEEIKRMITNLSDKVTTSHDNLKNKIVLSEKTMGDKIDKLNAFDESLKGNGDPGIWESVRNIKKNIRIIILIILVILLLTLGGNFRGLTFESIKERIGLGEKQPTKQVELTPKIEVIEIIPIVETPEETSKEIILEEVPKIKTTKEEKSLNKGFLI